MGDIVTASGTRFLIGPTPAASVDTLAEFAALSYVEVGLIETLGEVGDEANAVTGAALGDGRVRKAKGARDAGTMPVTVFHDPADAGQLAMIDAEASNNNYAFKIILPDGPTTSSTDTIQYFKGLVMSKRLNIGENDNIIRRTFNVGVNSQMYESPAAGF